MKICANIGSTLRVSLYARKICANIGKQAIRMLLLLICVSMTAFFLVSLSPVDPLQANVGQAALGSMSQEQIAKLESYWGVGEPPVERFLSWASQSAPDSCFQEPPDRHGNFPLVSAACVRGDRC